MSPATTTTLGISSGGYKINDGTIKIRSEREMPDICSLSISEENNSEAATMGISFKNYRVSQEEKTSPQETDKSRMERLKATVIEGKHLAKRDASQWIDYGDPKIWDLEFESAVTDASERIKRGTLKTPYILEHFEKIRFKIASKRKNKKAFLFGLRRDFFSKNLRSICWTNIQRQNIVYGYALERAVKIPYDGKWFIESQSDDGKSWATHDFYGSGAHGTLRYGLVQGFIDGKPIPLTQYVFCPRNSFHRSVESEEWFGAGDQNYVGDNKESGLWLHTGREQIPTGLDHIEKLVDKAVAGDLSVVPRIHWWYVHLAPTWRGPGGIAEMITNTLCRLHGIDLPPWKDGVAPSVEVLLEPNEEKFCSNYHQLFALDQEKLKTLFNAQN